MSCYGTKRDLTHKTHNPRLRLLNNTSNYLVNTNLVLNTNNRWPLQVGGGYGTVSDLIPKH